MVATNNLFSAARWHSRALPKQGHSPICALIAPDSLTTILFASASILFSSLLASIIEMAFLMIKLKNFNTVRLKTFYSCFRDSCVRLWQGKMTYTCKNMVLKKIEVTSHFRLVWYTYHLFVFLDNNRRHWNYYNFEFESISSEVFLLWICHFILSSYL